MKTSSKALEKETIVFTGTLKSQDLFDLVERHGGKPVSLPLIRVSEVRSQTDRMELEGCSSYDWLIFTSQNAVTAFCEKLKRHDISPDTITSNVAAIGTKTAEALEKIGFSVQFIPTVFSADVFVKEFKPTKDDPRRLLFLRGTLAGPTIAEELPFVVEEWTVYETEKIVENVDSLVSLIEEESGINVLFASPSAVQVFAEEVVSKTGWDGYAVGAIGHVTERALEKAGATVHARPDTYTLKHLIEKLVEKKGRNE